MEGGGEEGMEGGERGKEAILPFRRNIRNSDIEHTTSFRRKLLVEIGVFYCPCHGRLTFFDKVEFEVLVRGRVSIVLHYALFDYLEFSSVSGLCILCLV